MDLNIEGLSKRYPNGVQALDNVSLTIPAGLFGLLGPNGAGKSTLMRTLATLQDADAGRARLGDIDVLGEKDRVRQLLGYLPQEFGLYPKVTAFEMLDYLASLKGVAPARRRTEEVHALLRRTNLYEVRHRRLGTFSGGMKQRFGIAQALLGRPRLVIVDEPTAGLDPEERARFHNLLADIGQEVIVILSTHIVADVSDLCRQMAIIYRGQVVLTGEPLAVAGALDGKLWRKFVDETAEQAVTAAVASGHAAGGAAATAAAATRGGGWTLVRGRRVAGRTCLHVYAAERPDPTFEPVAPELEDAYFWAIRKAGGTPDAAVAPAAPATPGGAPASPGALSSAATPPAGA
jgi:ABC-2 type transport system ATP-binding protein